SLGKIAFRINAHFFGHAPVPSTAKIDMPDLFINDGLYSSTDILIFDANQTPKNGFARIKARAFKIAVNNQNAIKQSVFRRNGLPKREMNRPVSPIKTKISHISETKF